MSFGKNPHVAKAEAAEQKAADATDRPARTSAYREAAHQWDRAAAREQPGKRRTEYEAKAEHNRALADEEPDAMPRPSTVEAATPPTTISTPTPRDPRSLN